MSGHPVPPKATEILDRFREIIADPLNLLIERHPLAGVATKNLVCLHNGLSVPLSGRRSYYAGFSEILVLNRGVHEPLEEFVFQELLKVIGPAPVMLELGAYWGHYSMWLKQRRPAAIVYLVEPDRSNLAAGKENFARNGFAGHFIHDTVDARHFEVDRFLDENRLDRLDILHADIQGAEVTMLKGCQRAFALGKVSHCFVSTHSQALHLEVIAVLAAAGFRIEASADFDRETTSFDGFVFAARDGEPEILRDFRYLGRERIATANPDTLVEALIGYRRAIVAAPPAAPAG